MSLARTGQGLLSFHRPLISVYSENQECLAVASTAQLARSGRGVLGQIWEAVETRNRTVGRVMDKTDPPLQAAPV